MSSSATLREVAEKAGVSIGTASQAINNRPNVAPETRARVLDAAVSLGYQAKEPTSVFNGQPDTVSVVGMVTMHEYGTPVGPNVFYSHVQSGVESECRRRGIGLMYSNIEVDHRKRPVEWPAIIRDQHVEGLLLIGAFVEDTIEDIQNQINVPLVLVDAYATNMIYDSVLIENIDGARQAVQHLVDNGHRNIGLLGWNEDAHPSIQERRQAYEQVLRENDLPVTYIEPSMLNRTTGMEATLRLLRRSPEVTAIFGCNDESAIGALIGARSLGRCLPDDLSVVGFDNIDIARAVTPALTTIHVHKTWLGVVAVRHLIERSQNPDQPRLKTRIATQLIVRDSVCPARA
jgi:LacI family transcriptional regulator